MDGKTGREIADILGIGIKTVETHKRSLFESYCVKNGTGLFKQCFLLDEIHREDFSM
ncbi:hypothetical protein AGMMS49546_29670 [Spirochaetia bacterium]|nr:hypothetical protein AGMMS49546_29670 [Spirochaetia bacterium]